MDDPSNLHPDHALKAPGWGVVEGSRIRREYGIAPGRIEGDGRRGKALIADDVLEHRNPALSEFVRHFHRERNHQGKENVILFPEPADRTGAESGQIRARERLGGLLRFYYREAT